MDLQLSDKASTLITVPSYSRHYAGACVSFEHISSLTMPLGWPLGETRGQYLGCVNVNVLVLILLKCTSCTSFMLVHLVR